MIDWVGRVWDTIDFDFARLVYAILLSLGDTMGWLRLVGSLKLSVSFENIGLFCRALLQKRPIIWRSLRIVATPHICDTWGILTYVRDTRHVKSTGIHTHICDPSCVWRIRHHHVYEMMWCVIGSVKLQVSFAKEPSDNVAKEPSDNVTQRYVT